MKKVLAIFPGKHIFVNIFCLLLICVFDHQMALGCKQGIEEIRSALAAIPQHLTRSSASVILSSERPFILVFLSTFLRFPALLIYSPGVTDLPLVCHRSSCRFHKQLGTAVPPHVSAYVTLLWISSLKLSFKEFAVIVNLLKTWKTILKVPNKCHWCPQCTANYKAKFKVKLKLKSYFTKAKCRIAKHLQECYCLMWMAYMKIKQ